MGYSNIKIERDVYSSETHKMIIETTKSFYEKEIVPFHEKWEKNKMVDREIWLKAGELGLLCLDVPNKYGGMELDFTHCAAITEEASKTCCTGPGFFLHSDIVTPYIVDFGTEEQKQKWLPKMIKGEIITAIAMTEPSCGSDLQSLKTTASYKNGYYILNGSKTFITNGYLSDLVIVAARTNSGKENEGISLFLVDTKLDGFTKGTPFDKIGMKAQDTCELFFDNVKLPKDSLLGQEGKGFKYIMMELARERHICSIMASGSTEAALEETIKYTSERKAFKGSIADFQNTQFKLAECATQLQVHQVFIDKCTEMLKNKKLSSEIASMSKYTSTEMQFKVLDECLQLFGGYGYMWEYNISKFWADSRVQRIYAGTNEIMKLVISRGILKK